MPLRRSDRAGAETASITLNDFNIIMNDNTNQVIDNKLDCVKHVPALKP